MIALLAACTVAWTPPERPAGAFPHPDGFEAGALHGAAALDTPTVCWSCHAERDCADCHPTYPHAFTADRVHPPAVDDCATCHEAAGSVAERTAGCASCHPSYPHPQGWGDAGRHGAWALAGGSPDVACGGCHGADLGGGSSGVGCADCHVAWPHPEGWDHGQAALPDAAACAGCHGEGGIGGFAGAPCTACHEGLPHPDGWREGGHQAATAQRGERPCLVCHRQGDGPDTMPATCARTCHGSAP